MPATPSVRTSTPAAQIPQKPRGGKRKKQISRPVPALPFPLASLVHPLRSSASQWLALPILLMVAFLFRWAVGLGPYSGMWLWTLERVAILLTRAQG